LMLYVFPSIFHINSSINPFPKLVFGSFTENSTSKSSESDFVELISPEISELVFGFIAMTFSILSVSFSLPIISIQT